MYSLFTATFWMFVIPAIITEWCHSASFLTFIRRSIKYKTHRTDVSQQQLLGNSRRNMRTFTLCVCCPPPLEDTMRITVPRRLISSSSCWGSSGSRSCWRGWWGWRSNQTPLCSWNRGSRTLWIGCSPCGGGRAQTAPGEEKRQTKKYIYVVRHFTGLWTGSGWRLPAAETWGISSTTGTSACVGQ